MNIKNRVAAIENKIGTNSAVCNCRETEKTELVLIDATEDCFNERQNLSETLPEICRSCGKPIEKQINVLMLVDAD